MDDKVKLSLVYRKGDLTIEESTDIPLALILDRNKCGEVLYGQIEDSLLRFHYNVEAGIKKYG